MSICEDQNKKSLDDRIDEVFSAENMKKFRDEVFKDIMNESTTDKSGTTKKKRGRPNKGLTEKHRKEYNENKLKEYHQFKEVNQPNNFNSEIIEKVNGEVLTDDIKDFEELYKLTWHSVLDSYLSDNPQLSNKHPNVWYKPLLLTLKQNIPKITVNELDKCIVVWNNLYELLNLIGLFMSYEAFRKVTDIDKYQIEKKAELSPKYKDFLQKIYNDCKDDLQSELLYSPYNSVNKIYLNKAVYGVVERDEPRKIEVVHSVRNYDSLPMFGASENEKP